MPSRMALAWPAKLPPYMSIRPIVTGAFCALAGFTKPVETERAIDATIPIKPNFILRLLVWMKWVGSVRGNFSIFGIVQALLRHCSGFAYRYGGYGLDLDKSVGCIERDLDSRTGEINSCQDFPANFVHAGIILAGSQKHGDLDQVRQRAAGRFDDIADIFKTLPCLHTDVPDAENDAGCVAGNHARCEDKLGVRDFDALSVGSFGLGDLG